MGEVYASGDERSRYSIDFSGSGVDTVMLSNRRSRTPSLALLGLPRYCGASGMFAQARTDDIAAIMRKKASSLVRRLRDSNNGILRMIDERVDSPSAYTRWRPRSLINLMSIPRREKVLQSGPSAEDVRNTRDSSHGPYYSQHHANKDKSVNVQYKKKGWDTIVTVVVVDAKGLPDPPRNDPTGHTIFCEIRLGTETFKSKSVPSSYHPKWRERLNLHLNKDDLLKVSLWDKGKQKNCMGSCVIDLSRLERERTHEITQELDDGFGSIHLSVTMCTIRNHTSIPDNNQNIEDTSIRPKLVLFDFKSDWKVVGQLYVKLIMAKGLSGLPNAYCTLEVDNERVQSHSARTGTAPRWNKYYVFNVYDVTSTLDLKVCDSSLVTILTEYLGKVSIPLLRIRNGEMRWYALKDRSKRHNAKGNCPRVLLEMSFVFNPVKATMRLFRPKEIKYIKTPPKFNIGLIYNNVEFIRDIFDFLYQLNESFKRFLEWENRELSSLALVIWLVFWYHFRMWTAPLLLLMPFIYYWTFQRNQGGPSFKRVYNTTEDENEQKGTNKNGKTLSGRIQDLPEMTLAITNNIEYVCSLVERVYNLVAFKVPFLSYLAMIFLIFASLMIYFIPFNYVIMAFGTYKYMRKFLNPERILNNDLLDFISKIPDNELLKDWKELYVPEPNNQRSSSNSLVANYQ